MNWSPLKIFLLGAWRWDWDLGWDWPAGAIGAEGSRACFSNFEVQPPQGDVPNVEFKNGIQMLTQVVTTQVGRQGADHQDGNDASRFLEFLRMNPLEFTGSKLNMDFDHWKKNRNKGAPQLTWVVFEGAFLGRFFPHELREAKEYMRVQEYNLKFTQQSHYAPEMVADMRSRMILFVSGLSRLSSKKGKATILIGDMDIDRLTIHVQHQRSFVAGPSLASACTKGAQGSQSLGSVVQGFARNLLCGKCGELYPKECCVGIDAAPVDRATPRGVTSRTGEGANYLYAITSRQDQENSPDVVTSMLKVFTFNVYALIDP
ncbi:hypothetical protein H5410_035923, partial [Solanum commersonii]